MWIDPKDNTEVYLTGALVSDFGSMCYVAEIIYTMSSATLPPLITCNPHKVREKYALGSYNHLQKYIRVYQIVKNNNKVNYYSVASDTISKSIKNMTDVNDVIASKADFGLMSKENQIVIKAISKFNL